MKTTIAALLAAACLIAPVTAATSADAAPIVKNDHRPAVHTSSWTRGHRLSSFDRRRAVPLDFRRYRLSTPPHGYRWVRIGGSFLMVGQTSGLILRVVTAR